MSRCFRLVQDVCSSPSPNVSRESKSPNIQSNEDALDDEENGGPDAALIRLALQKAIKRRPQSQSSKVHNVQSLLLLFSKILLSDRQFVFDSNYRGSRRLTFHSALKLLFVRVGKGQVIYIGSLKNCFQENLSNCVSNILLVFGIP